MLFILKLLGTAAETLPTINPDVMKNGNGLARHQQLELIKTCNKRIGSLRSKRVLMVISRPVEME